MWYEGIRQLEQPGVEVDKWILCQSIVNRCFRNAVLAFKLVSDFLVLVAGIRTLPLPVLACGAHTPPHRRTLGLK